MVPRITINKNKNGEIEISLNESGRDLLVKKLSELNESNDHLHLAPSDGYNDIPLRTKAYLETDEVFPWAKIMFRPDHWDARYFPHVLDSLDDTLKP